MCSYNYISPLIVPLQTDQIHIALNIFIKCSCSWRLRFLACWSWTNPGFQSSSVLCSHVSPWLESPRCLGRVYMNCAQSCLIPSDICIAQILSAPSHFVICHHLLTTNQIYKYPSLPSPSPPTSESPHHPILLVFLWHPSWRAFNIHTSISICWSLIIVSEDNASVGIKAGPW